jgi:hypothetical protein
MAIGTSKSMPKRLGIEHGRSLEFKERLFRSLQSASRDHWVKLAQIDSIILPSGTVAAKSFLPAAV